MKLPTIKILLSLALLAALTGCDSGIKQMGATEYGVRFRRLPPLLGGGVGKDVISPTQMTLVWPWDTIYRFDLRVQDVSWGPGKGGGDQVRAQDLLSTQNAPLPPQSNGSETEDLGESDSTHGGYVNTRAQDGNEVALAVTVAYQVSTDPEKLVHLVQNVATSDREVRDLVVAVARADIRTNMNYLETSAFLEDKQRYEAVDKVRASMNARLEPLGISVKRVNLNDFRFERVMEDGTVDTSYQDKLKEIQRIRQDTERERQRSKTVKAKKEQELNEAQAEVNRKIAEANGFLEQAKFRGDAYFQSKENDAKAILATGKAQVTGLIEQVNALSGPGGAAILKLELARQLLLHDPKFVVMDEAQGAQGLGIRRTDSNELLRQIGILDALGSPSKDGSSARGDETVQVKPPTARLNGSLDSSAKNSTSIGEKK